MNFVKNKKNKKLLNWIFLKNWQMNNFLNWILSKNWKMNKILNWILSKNGKMNTILNWILSKRCIEFISENQNVRKCKKNSQISMTQHVCFFFSSLNAVKQYWLWGQGAINLKRVQFYNTSRLFVLHCIYPTQSLAAAPEGWRPRNNP